MAGEVDVIRVDREIGRTVGMHLQLAREEAMGWRAEGHPLNELIVIVVDGRLWVAPLQTLCGRLPSPLARTVQALARAVDLESGEMWALLLRDDALHMRPLPFRLLDRPTA